MAERRLPIQSTRSKMGRRVPELFCDGDVVLHDGNKKWFCMREGCYDVTLWKDGKKLIIEDFRWNGDRFPLYEKLSSGKIRLLFRFYKDKRLLYTVSTDGKLYSWKHGRAEITKHDWFNLFELEDVEGCLFCGKMECEDYTCQEYTNYCTYRAFMYGIPD